MELVNLQAARDVPDEENERVVRSIARGQWAFKTGNLASDPFAMLFGLPG